MMRDKLKILLLSPYLPAADTTACARKVYDCARLLNQRGHRIYLVSFCSEQDKTKIFAIRQYCAQLHLEYLKDYSRYPHNPVPLKQKIEALCKNGSVDILQCERSYMARYLPEHIKAASVLTEHEVLSVSFAERLRVENNFFTKVVLFIRKIKKNMEENKWYGSFDKIIVFSENDKYCIRKLYGLKNIDIIPLGIDLKSYPLQDKKEKSYDLIFVGNFSHSPNVDAVLYFYKEILPLIKNRLPCVSAAFVGANPPESIKNLAKSDRNILVTGYAKDILEYYSKAKVFIAPIRYGTGMRFKILEALASGAAVVTTSIGARGINSEDVLKVADGKYKFADAVIELLGAADKRRELAIRGREAAERYYDWSRLLDKYEDIYYSLLHLLPD